MTLDWAEVDQVVDVVVAVDEYETPAADGGGGGGVDSQESQSSGKDAKSAVDWQKCLNVDDSNTAAQV